MSDDLLEELQQELRSCSYHSIQRSWGMPFGFVFLVLLFLGNVMLSVFHLSVSWTGECRLDVGSFSLLLYLGKFEISYTGRERATID